MGASAVSVGQTLPRGPRQAQGLSRAEQRESRGPRGDSLLGQTSRAAAVDELSDESSVCPRATEELSRSHKRVAATETTTGAIVL